MSRGLAEKVAKNRSKFSDEVKSRVGFFARPNGRMELYKLVAETVNQVHGQGRSDRAIMKRVRSLFEKGQAINEAMSRVKGRAEDMNESSSKLVDFYYLLRSHDFVEKDSAVESNPLQPSSSQ